MKQLRAPLSVVLVLALALGTTAAQADTGNAETTKPSGAAATSSKNQPRFTPARTDALTRALERAQLTPAQYALQRAMSLFHPRLVARAFGDVSRPDPHMATAILRDLLLRRGELSGEDRAAADSLLARPDDSQGGAFGERYTSKSQSSCLALPRKICVHWVTTGSDATTPAQVDATMATMARVWDAEVTELGFRPPKSDKNSSNHGPDAKTDIYLANVGSNGIYGYCTSDDPRGNRLGTSRYPYYDISAYCVLDNDFLEFPDQTPLANLQVTAAHEFFHAIQYGYDAYEDFWLLEGSATAIEDVVFNDINDNYQFLLSSQFVTPHKPVDKTSLDPGGPHFSNRYGAWIFFRYLTEAFGAPGVPDPTALRSIWDRADGSKHKRFGDKPSIRAVKNYVASKNVRFPKMFASFGVQMRLPELFLEGDEYLSFLQSRGGDRAPITRSYELGPDTPTSGWVTKKINHLGHRYYEFTRAVNTAEDAVLKFNFDLPGRKKSPVATVLVHSSSGTQVVDVPIGRAGGGKIKVPFGADVSSAVLILTNASTRFTKCEKRLYVYTTSCGRPRDNKQPFTFKAKVI